MTPGGRAAVEGELARHREARVTRVLRALRVPSSVWYYRPLEERRKPGPKPKPIPERFRERIKELAGTYPWWGFKRIAVIARREGLKIGNKRVYRIFQEEGLLQRPRVRAAEVYQAARLFELLPSAPNDLWQADVERQEALLNPAVIRGHRRAFVAANALKLRAALPGGRQEGRKAALTTTERVGTTRRSGFGKRDGKAYVRNQRPKAPQDCRQLEPGRSGLDCSAHPRPSWRGELPNRVTSPVGRLR